MKIPPLQGSLDQSGFFIYAAADSKYFDDYGKPLINSVLRNTTYGIHLHIYDPTDDQLAWCRAQRRLSVSWEHIDAAGFDTALALWSRDDLAEPYRSRKNKMLGLKVVDHSLSDQDNLRSWLKKTYYACMRFVRLAELLGQSQTFLAIDVDGIVRSDFVREFSDGRDFYLHEKQKGGHLAGAILATNSDQCLDFIKRLGSMIKNEIESDNLFWFLDQWCLDLIVNDYNKGTLPMSYIDWQMESGSAIWSAKGKRKFRDIFQLELRKYQ